MRARNEPPEESAHSVCKLRREKLLIVRCSPLNQIKDFRYTTSERSSTDVIMRPNATENGNPNALHKQLAGVKAKIQSGKEMLEKVCTCRGEDEEMPSLVHVRVLEACAARWSEHRREKPELSQKDPCLCSSWQRNWAVLTTTPSLHSAERFE